MAAMRIFFGTAGSSLESLATRNGATADWTVDELLGAPDVGRMAECCAWPHRAAPQRAARVMVGNDA
jgi:hypothetical protein